MHAHCNPGHIVNFENIHVLVKTQKYIPTLVKEAIETEKLPNNFNRDDSYKL